MDQNALSTRFGSEDVVIVYDGGCPFCANYVRLARLRAEVGPVRLVNAREDPALCDALMEMGCDLDHGMVMWHEGRLYHGDECLNRMAVLAAGDTAFGRLTRAVFRHRWLARVLYPPMVFGRNLTLALLGRSRLWDRRP